MAFWAELYQPKRGARRTKTSHLTDELCGGFGSRYSLASMLDDKHLEQIQTQLDATPAESEELARQAALKREKAKAKKDRQKARKAEGKAEADAEESRLAQEMEEKAVEQLRAAKISAPALHAFDWNKGKASVVG